MAAGTTLPPKPPTQPPAAPAAPASLEGPTTQAPTSRWIRVARVFSPIASLVLEIAEYIVYAFFGGLVLAALWAWYLYHLGEFTPNDTAFLAAEATLLLAAAAVLVIVFEIEKLRKKRDKRQPHERAVVRLVLEHIPFDDLFEMFPNGQVGPRRLVRVGSWELGPGASLGPGVKFNGVDVSEWRGGQVWGREESGVFVIERFSRSKKIPAP